MDDGHDKWDRNTLVKNSAKLIASPNLLDDRDMLEIICLMNQPPFDVPRRRIDFEWITRDEWFSYIAFARFSGLDLPSLIRPPLPGRTVSLGTSSMFEGNELNICSFSRCMKRERIVLWRGRQLQRWAWWAGWEGWLEGSCILLWIHRPRSWPIHWKMSLRRRNCSIDWPSAPGLSSS